MKSQWCQVGVGTRIVVSQLWLGLGFLVAGQVSLAKDPQPAAAAATGTVTEKTEGAKGTAASTSTATGTSTDSGQTKKGAAAGETPAGTLPGQPVEKGVKAAESMNSKTPAAVAGTVVEMKTSEGVIKLELADKEAPITVKNFLSYVDEKFYDGLIFHRVIKDFMIQGGGYSVQGDKMTEKPTKAPITNEAKNGLKNDRGTIAMARTQDPNSATAQFYINHVNNNNLDHPSFDGHGYAVFGKVLEGMDVVDKIANAKTGVRGGMPDVPVTDIKIISVQTVKPAGH